MTAIEYIGISAGDGAPADGVPHLTQTFKLNSFNSGVFRPRRSKRLEKKMRKKYPHLFRNGTVLHRIIFDPPIQLHSGDEFKYTATVTLED